jgi:hypothetical protein
MEVVDVEAGPEYPPPSSFLRINGEIRPIRRLSAEKMEDDFLPLGLGKLRA